MRVFYHLKNRLVSAFIIVFIRNTFKLVIDIITTPKQRESLYMWKVVESSGKFLIEKRVMLNMVLTHIVDGKIYKTPYRIEAQQIADELNGESNASNQ